MRVELIPAISEFIQTQISFQKILGRLVHQFDNFNSAMIWEGIESRENFINKLKLIAHGIQDLDTTPWVLAWDKEGELVSVVKRIAGAEIEITPDDAKNFVKDLCNSICSGSLNHHLDVMCSLALSQLHYGKFLKKYFKDNSNLESQLLTPFQRLTKLPLLLERISKYSDTSEQRLCIKAIEVINAKIAKTNEAMPSNITTFKKNEERKINIEAKIIKIKNDIRILSQKKTGIFRGVFRDKLKAPLQKLIVDTANLLIEELQNPNISTKYTDDIRDELGILQKLARFKGNGADLREIALPFITNALKLIRPAQPDYPKPMPATANASLPQNTSASMTEAHSHKSTLDFFADAAKLKSPDHQHNSPNLS